MKFAILAFVIFIGNLSSQGIALAQPNDYRAVETLFASGHAAQADQLIGWFSGRCFHYGSQETESNTLFAGWRESDAVFKAIMITKSDAPADFFDNMSDQDNRDIETVIHDQKNNALPTEIENDGLKATGSYDFGTITWNLRESDNYTVVHTVFQNHTYAYCYLLKKLN